MRVLVCGMRDCVVTVQVAAERFTRPVLLLLRTCVFVCTGVDCTFLGVGAGSNLLCLDVCPRAGIIQPSHLIPSHHI